MRVLIIGTDGRTGSSMYAQRYYTFAGLIADAHTSVGHDARIDDVDATSDPAYLASWDRIYVGLSSPTSISSFRTYGTLRALNWLLSSDRPDNSFALFFDNPNVRGIRNGFVSAARVPDRMWSPYLHKRQGFEAVAASTKEGERLRTDITNAVRNLVENVALPRFPVLFPQRSWATNVTFQVVEQTGGLAGLSNATFSGVDMDPLVLSDTETRLRAASAHPDPMLTGMHWVGEGDYVAVRAAAKLVEQPVLAVKPRTGRDVRLDHYRNPDLLGVLDVGRAALPGWWTPYPAIAASSSVQCYYYTDQDTLTVEGAPLAAIEAYSRYLPSQRALLSPSDCADVIDAQWSVVHDGRTTSDILERLGVRAHTWT